MRRWLRKFISLLLKSSAVLLILSLLLGLGSPYINPYHFWPAAFFGLAFPVFWILSLGLTILIFNRKPWFYSLLFFVLVASPMMFNHFSLPLRSNKSTPDDYKIVTYNVHGFSGIRDGKTSFEMQKEAIEFIKEVGPSVICMQEFAVRPKNYPWPQKFLINEIKIPYNQLSEFNPDFNGTTFCLMIASTFPVNQKGVIYTPENVVFGMFADIQFPDGVIRVYNIHLESVKLIVEKKLLRPHRNPGIFIGLLSNLKGTYRKLKSAFPARAYQAWKIAESIRHSPYPVIVAGDFNDTPASYSYRMIKNGLKDAAIFKGFGFHRTYAESLYPIRIDQVLIDHKLTSGSYSRRKIYLSDHYPVVAGFSFKTSR